MIQEISTVERGPCVGLQDLTASDERLSTKDLTPSGSAQDIRVTGTNLENIARGRYNSEAGTMVVEKRPNFALPRE